MDSERQFWNWFIQHETELLEFEKNREAVFNQLAAEMRKVDPNLVFEFGPRADRREFVISADGIRNSFATGISLAKAAPNLSRREVTALRPRRTTYSAIEMRGRRVDPEHVRLSLLDHGENAGNTREIMDGAQTG